MVGGMFWSCELGLEVDKEACRGKHHRARCFVEGSGFHVWLGNRFLLTIACLSLTFPLLRGGRVSLALPP